MESRVAKDVDVWQQCVNEPDQQGTEYTRKDWPLLYGDRRKRVRFKVRYRIRQRILLVFEAEVQIKCGAASFLSPCLHLNGKLI